LEKAHAKYDDLAAEKTKVESQVDALTLQLATTNRSDDTSKKQIGITSRLCFSLVSGCCVILVVVFVVV
jgi:hypothetical protein